MSIEITNIENQTQKENIEKKDFLDGKKVYEKFSKFIKYLLSPDSKKESPDFFFKIFFLTKN